MKHILKNITTNIEEMKVDLFFTEKNGCENLGYDATPHIHVLTEIILVSEGNCVLYTDKEIYSIDKHSICIVPRGCIHTIEPGSIQGEVISLLVNINKSGKNTKGDGESVTDILNGDEFILIKDCRNIIDYAEKFLKCTDSEKQSEYIYSFLSEISARIPENSIVKSQKYEKRIFRQEDYILEYFITENYMRRFSINNIAKFVGYSPTYTARKIKRNYGVTYSELIMRLKMSYARKLLVMTNIPFYEIAMSVGYDSYNGFGLAFKKYFKKTPEQMRRENSGII